MTHSKKYIIAVSMFTLFASYTAQGAHEAQPKRAVWQDSIDYYLDAIEYSPEPLLKTISALINAKVNLNERSDLGDTLIHIICTELTVKSITEEDAQQSIEHLVEAGAQLGATDADGDSAFACMAETLKPQTFAYFLDKYLLYLSTKDVENIQNNTDISAKTKGLMKSLVPQNASKADGKKDERKKNE